MGILDSLKKMFGGGSQTAPEAPAEDAMPEAPAEETPADEGGSDEQAA